MPRNFKTLYITNMKLVSEEQIQALSKLSAEMRKLTNGKHYEKFALKVYEYNHANFWEWFKEKQESAKYLERLINGAIKNKKNDHAKQLIFLSSQLTLSEEMYFKVITVDAVIREKDNKIAELESDKFRMSDKIKEQQKEIEKLTKVLNETEL